MTVLKDITNFCDQYKIAFICKFEPIFDDAYVFAFVKNETRREFRIPRNFGDNLTILNHFYLNIQPDLICAFHLKETEAV